jgi:osmoprotectant transport system permease protein
VTITGSLGDRFGGLGFFIFEGYRRGFATEMLFGAVPSMLLAIVVDLALVAVQRRMTPWARAGSGSASVPDAIDAAGRAQDVAAA